MPHFFAQAEITRGVKLCKMFFFEQTNAFFDGNLLTKANYGNYEMIVRSR